MVNPNQNLWNRKGLCLKHDINTVCLCCHKRIRYALFELFFWNFTIVFFLWSKKRANIDDELLCWFTWIFTACAIVCIFKYGVCTRQVGWAWLNRNFFRSLIKFTYAFYYNAYNKIILIYSIVNWGIPCTKTD